MQWEEKEIVLLLYVLWKKLRLKPLSNSLLIVQYHMWLRLLNNRPLLNNIMRPETQLIGDYSPRHKVSSRLLFNLRNTFSNSFACHGREIHSSSTFSIPLYQPKKVLKPAPSLSQTEGIFCFRSTEVSQICEINIHSEAKPSTIRYKARDLFSSTKIRVHLSIKCQLSSSVMNAKKKKKRI